MNQLLPLFKYAVLLVLSSLSYTACSEQESYKAGTPIYMASGGEQLTIRRDLFQVPLDMAFFTNNSRQTLSYLNFMLEATSIPLYNKAEIERDCYAASGLRYVGTKMYFGTLEVPSGTKVRVGSRNLTFTASGTTATTSMISYALPYIKRLDYIAHNPSVIHAPAVVILAESSLSNNTRFILASTKADKKSYKTFMPVRFGGPGAAAPVILTSKDDFNLLKCFSILNGHAPKYADLWASGVSISGADHWWKSARNPIFYTGYQYHCKVVDRSDHVYAFEGEVSSTAIEGHGVIVMPTKPSLSGKSALIYGVNTHLYLRGGGNPVLNTILAKHFHYHPGLATAKCRAYFVKTGYQAAFFLSQGKNLTLDMHQYKSTSTSAPTTTARPQSSETDDEYFFGRMANYDDLMERVVKRKGKLDGLEDDDFDKLRDVPLPPGVYIKGDRLYRRPRRVKKWDASWASGIPFVESFTHVLGGEGKSGSSANGKIADIADDLADIDSKFINIAKMHDADHKKIYTLIHSLTSSYQNYRKEVKKNLKGVETNVLNAVDLEQERRIKTDKILAGQINGLQRELTLFSISEHNDMVFIQGAQAEVDHAQDDHIQVVSYYSNFQALLGLLYTKIKLYAVKRKNQYTRYQYLSLFYIGKNLMIGLNTIDTVGKGPMIGVVMEKMMEVRCVDGFANTPDDTPMVMANQSVRFVSNMADFDDFLIAISVPTEVSRSSSTWGPCRKFYLTAKGLLFPKTVSMEHYNYKTGTMVTATHPKGSHMIPDCRNNMGSYICKNHETYPGVRYGPTTMETNTFLKAIHPTVLEAVRRGEEMYGFPDLEVCKVADEKAITFAHQTWKNDAINLTTLDENTGKFLKSNQNKEKSAYKWVDKKIADVHKLAEEVRNMVGDSPAWLQAVAIIALVLSGFNTIALVVVFLRVAKLAKGDLLCMTGFNSEAGDAEAFVQLITISGQCLLQLYLIYKLKRKEGSATSAYFMGTGALTFYKSFTNFLIADSFSIPPPLVTTPEQDMKRDCPRSRYDALNASFTALQVWSMLFLTAIMVATQLNNYVHSPEAIATRLGEDRAREFLRGAIAGAIIPVSKQELASMITEANFGFVSSGTVRNILAILFCLTMAKSCKRNSAKMRMFLVYGAVLCSLYHTDLPPIGKMIMCEMFYEAPGLLSSLLSLYIVSGYCTLPTALTFFSAAVTITGKRGKSPIIASCAGLMLLLTFHFSEPLSWVPLMRVPGAEGAPFTIPQAVTKTVKVITAMAPKIEVEIPETEIISVAHTVVAIVVFICLVMLMIPTFFYLTRRELRKMRDQLLQTFNHTSLDGLLNICGVPLCGKLGLISCKVIGSGMGKTTQEFTVGRATRRFMKKELNRMTYRMSGTRVLELVSYTCEGIESAIKAVTDQKENEMLGRRACRIRTWTVSLAQLGMTSVTGAELYYEGIYICKLSMFNEDSAYSFENENEDYELSSVERRKMEVASRFEDGSIVDGTTG